MKIDRSKGFFNAKKVSDKKAAIDIYGDIVDDKYTESETSAISFRDALNELGDVKEIDVTINSPGGSVFSGINIFNQIVNHPAHVTVNISGLAASIASVIAMAADTVKISSNSMLMIHEVWAPFVGNHRDMKKFAEDLEKINQTVFNSYLSKNPELDHDELKTMMANETWLTAQEALNLGLVDEVTGANKAVARISKEMEGHFKNMPNLNNEEPKQEVTAEEVVGLLEEIKSDLKTLLEKAEGAPKKEESETPNNFMKLFK
ncbi:head maturation protease, ClpP-related [Staphylococcus massiliensis]|uniref:ATP-dependent Clp protease proteolytic subunit n=1 Tax=Staphylococcus massiliensis S46 TaxID=1229783 RepID=K9ASE7_9STAP|nr:head maturation protease, ClpP-related [Staphylococcus massiliensis]EKU50323.1 Prophage Clp protease-like protein [Staphylococcus massiliensis S46]